MIGCCLTVGSKEAVADVLNYQFRCVHAQINTKQIVVGCFLP